MSKTTKVIIGVVVGICLTIGVLFFGCCAMVSTALSGPEDSSIAVEQAESVGAENGVFGDYVVYVEGARLTSDYEGKPAIIVSYNFTNYSEESQSFWTAFADTLYQNGVGLSTAVLLDDSYNEMSQTQEIKKGASITVEKAYVLNDSESDIEVEITDWLGFSDNVYIETIVLSEIK